MNQSLLTSLLSDAKLRLGVKTNVFDSEISDLINAAATDLVRHNAAQTGQFDGEELDPLIKMAVMTFVKANYRYTDNAEQFKADYNEQKAMLMTTTGYTDWRETDGQI